ncbi:hypothetical protein [Spiroplasma endosymbiont of Asaphidion curtum]|uniref:hypothetical protein n=1 Tax=Spiroplasma endosymbiont of Asaphidion curtum TaxID=3066281 RepID=UPI00313DAC84
MIKRNSNHWKNINKITKKVTIFTKNKLWLGLILTFTVIAIIIPSIYLLTLDMVSVFSNAIINLEDSESKKIPDIKPKILNPDDGNGLTINPFPNDDSEPGIVNDSLLLDGAKINVENYDNFKSLRLIELENLVLKYFKNYVQSNKFLQANNKTYKKFDYRYKYITTENGKEIDNSFIQDDVEIKKVLVKDIEIYEINRPDIYEVINANIFSLSFNLKIINTNMFYKNYFNFYSFQGSREQISQNNITNATTGYLTSEWVLFTDKVLGKEIYREVNDSLRDFIFANPIEFGSDIKIKPIITTQCLNECAGINDWDTFREKLYDASQALIEENKTYHSDLVIYIYFISTNIKDDNLYEQYEQLPIQPFIVTNYFTNKMANQKILISSMNRLKQKRNKTIAEYIAFAISFPKFFLKKIQDWEFLNDNWKNKVKKEIYNYLYNYLVTNKKFNIIDDVSLPILSENQYPNLLNLKKKLDITEIKQINFNAYKYTINIIGFNDEEIILTGIGFFA